MDEILVKRTSILKKTGLRNGAVVYWMSREQRVENNWTLIYAFNLALEKRTSLAVVFCLVPEFLGATFRHYAFMVKGLQKVEEQLVKRNIPFYMLQGFPQDQITAFCNQYRVAHLITDFDPLKPKRLWLHCICKTVPASVTVVDAHNIVPAFVVSDTAEYGAYTLRPRLNRLLPIFLTGFPEIPFQKETAPFEFQCNNPMGFPSGGENVPEADWIKPGEEEALKALYNFVDKNLDKYAQMRNDPVEDSTSGLSPYLHFGQISAQLVAKIIINSGVNQVSSAAFLEELIVRKELSDNYCYYNQNYDSFDGFPAWAKKSLISHLPDKREFVYSSEQFENSLTHDELWNAAQDEMVLKGKMHGFMRMYWAKKILEWSATPQEALATAIYLNNKYELDGRDPNGYAGCAWAIGGVHDRAWNSHPVYGMVRYMNYSGCKRKFDVKKYIRVNRTRN